MQKRGYEQIVMIQTNISVMQVIKFETAMSVLIGTHNNDHMFELTYFEFPDVQYQCTMQQRNSIKQPKQFFFMIFKYDKTNITCVKN